MRAPGIQRAQPGARWYLQMAASSAMDSVFSQYHRGLWDNYRLLFAEYESGEEIEADFAGFLTPYLETDNWYPMALQETQAEEIVGLRTDMENIWKKRFWII